MTRHRFRSWLCLAFASAACGETKDATISAHDSGGLDAGRVEAGAPDTGTPGNGPVALDALPLAAACGGKTKAGVDGTLPTFERNVIGEQPGAGYVKPIDVDADGYPELLVSALTEGLDTEQTTQPPIGPGAGYLLRRVGGKPDGTLGTFEAEKLFDKTAQVYWPNVSSLVDIDNDGIKDWVIGGGFLIKPFATIPWIKGTRSGFEPGAMLLEVPNPSCWYHDALPTDLDGDGDEDFITSCHVGTIKTPNVESRVEWFENPGDDSGKFVPHSIAAGGGTLLALRDLDADGDQDIILPQYFGPESMVWLEQTEAKGAAWTKHVISVSTGKGFIVRFADMDGDGAEDMVYGNHNNEEEVDPVNQTMGIYWYSIPSSDEIAGLENWDSYIHTIYEGFEVGGTDNADSAGAPGMLNVGDIDGDCDIDVVASGDGDYGLYLFVQQADGFEKVDLSTDRANMNSGEQHMYDADGDGDMDIVWAVFGPPPGIADENLHSSVSVFLQE